MTSRSTRKPSSPLTRNACEPTTEVMSACASTATAAHSFGKDGATKPPNECAAGSEDCEEARVPDENVSALVSDEVPSIINSTPSFRSTLCSAPMGLLFHRRQPSGPSAPSLRPALRNGRTGRWKCAEQSARKGGPNLVVDRRPRKQLCIFLADRTRCFSIVRVCVNRV